MGRTSKITTYILAILMIFAWITKDTFDISLLAYLDYSKELTQEEQDYLDEVGGLTYGAATTEAPLSYVDNGEAKGIIVDYMECLGTTLGIDMKNVPIEKDEALQLIVEDQVDISNIGPTKKKNQKLNFSQSIYYLKGIVAVTAKNTEIKIIEDLDETSVIVVEDDYDEELFSAFSSLDLDIQLIFAQDIPDAIQMLLAGKGDAIAGDEMLIQHYTDSMGVKNQISILEDELYAKKVSIAVNDGQDMLLEVLNKGILQLKKDNMLHNLQISWFGSSNSSFKDTRENLWIPVFFAAFFGFAILLYIWDSILRKQIKLATIEINNQKIELRTIIDTIDACLIVIDEKEIVVETNIEAEKITGLAYKELLDRDISTLPVIGEVYSQYKANGEQTQKLKGSYYNVNENAYTTNTNKRLLLISDVTESVIAERKLRQENKMTAIGQLSAGLAHEIRNPLGLIKNYKYIIAGYATDEISKHAVNIIDNSAERINNLIENLLKFSRLGNEKSEWFDLSNTVKNIMLLEEKKAENEHIDIEIAMETPFFVYSNEETIRLVLFNLINNALEALGRYVTTKQKKIKVMIDRYDSNVRIRVMDNGAGISEENIENIFNPFFTTKESGTGLGLYIVSTELEKVQGTISVISREEIETVFTVLIPTEMEVM